MAYKDKEKQKEYQHNWHLKNKTKIAEREKEKRRRNRNIVEEFKSMGCSKCGENRIPCLDLHHRNSDEKEYLGSDLTRNSYSVKTVKKEIEKCDVLCANCHRILHWNKLHPENPC